MPGTELILPNGDKVDLPPALNACTETLYKRIQRLPDWLPTGVNARQFTMACISEINAIKKNVTPASVVKTVFNAAIVGLVPGKPDGNCWFIPYGNECTLVMGFPGVMKLAFDAKYLDTLHCEVVLKGEDFKRWVDSNGPQLHHELKIGRKLDYNQVEGVYCWWRTISGGTDHVFVERHDLDKVNSNRNVWKSFPIEMSYKTAIIRASKRWDKSRRLAAAVSLDDLASIGQSQPSLPSDAGEIINTVDVKSKPSLEEMGKPEPPEAEKPTEATAGAVSDASQLLEEYRGEFKRLGQEGIQAAVNDTLAAAERSIDEGDLPESARKEIMKSHGWATEALKRPDDELFG